MKNKTKNATGNDPSQQLDEKRILGKGRPTLPSTPPRPRKSAKVFEPLVVLQRPSLNSNTSDELGRQLDTNEMVDHLVNTLGLIGVSPSFPRLNVMPVPGLSVMRVCVSTSLKAHWAKEMSS